MMKAVEAPSKITVSVFLVDESEEFARTVYSQKGKLRTQLSSLSDHCSDFMFKVLEIFCPRKI